MKKLIVCPKTFGNTYKVCDYMSRELGIELKVINSTTKINLEDYDAIIVASGIYGNHPHKNISNWINNIQSRNIKSNVKFYTFFTWFGRGKSDVDCFNEIKNLLEQKNIKLEDNYMKCFGGGMGFVRKSHPNQDDYNNVMQWAKEL
ncbi:MAG: flavodoxin domain-containing protein [Sedimentibacter sp.]